MNMSHITVKAEREAGVTDAGPFKTVLWEKSPDHPTGKNNADGEIFIVTDGKEHRVGETAAVQKLLMSGRLVKVGDKPASKPDPKKDDKPVT